MRAALEPHALHVQLLSLCTCMCLHMMAPNTQRIPMIFICRLLSWLGREGRPDVALAAFDWLEGRPEYVTGDCHLYTRLTSIFGRLPNGAPAALGMFERMCQKGIRPDRMAFNCAIGAAGRPYHCKCVLHLCKVIPGKSPLFRQAAEGVSGSVVYDLPRCSSWCSYALTQRLADV